MTGYLLVFPLVYPLWVCREAVHSLDLHFRLCLECALYDNGERVWRSGSATASQAVGREFESPHPLQFSPQHRVRILIRETGLTTGVCCLTTARQGTEGRVFMMA